VLVYLKNYRIFGVKLVVLYHITNYEKIRIPLFNDVP